MSTTISSLAFSRNTAEWRFKVIRARVINLPTVVDVVGFPDLHPELGKRESQWAGTPGIGKLPQERPEIPVVVQCEACTQDMLAL